MFLRSFARSAAAWRLALVPLVCICPGWSPACAAAGPARPDEPRAEFAILEKLVTERRARPEVGRRWEAIAGEVFRPESLILASDRDPPDVVLRRTAALVAHLESTADAPDLSTEKARLAVLQSAAAEIAVEDTARRYRLFEQAVGLRRRIAFSNPLLDFDRILFVKRHRLPGEMMLGEHMCDQFFGFHAVAGGGLFVLEEPFGESPKARNVLADSVCENGRFRGKKLRPGAFLSPDLSHDAATVLFAYTEGEPTRYEWSPRSTFHVFKVGVDGSGLSQLTDGPTNDFDPCWLPDGRIAFISERRGGYGRCHPRPVPLFTLHVMNADGSCLGRLSHHEANEWQPSVDHHGMIVYTRWDYVDRGNIQAHHPWITTPGGRDARAVQGNFGRSKQARPTMELDVRAVPGSHKYVATAAAHHGQAFGSLVLVDPRVPDDGGMAPLARLTPEAPFPEAETRSGEGHLAATAWPLGEHFHLCVYDAEGAARRGTENNYGIYLLDAFGNKELIYRDPAVSCLSPIPLRPRRKPPIVAQVSETSDDPTPDPRPTAPVGVVNVYHARKPFPKDVRIEALRIIQVLPKTTPLINEPRVGYGNEKGARAVLGTVPVEVDGSAYFRLPVDKPVYFQALNERGLAVQSMRSATYVHRGKRLVCRGCHEPHGAAPLPTRSFPLAFRRPPSAIRPEVEGSNPFSFPRLVQPVLDRHCVACHQEEPEAISLDAGHWSKSPHGRYVSYESLMSYAFFYGKTEGTYDPWTEPRTEVGRFGARESKLYQLLEAGHYDVRLPEEDLHRLALWLDGNSDFFGSYDDTAAQARAEVVRPRLE
jgi:hypothetical protein